MSLLITLNGLNNFFDVQFNNFIKVSQHISIINEYQGLNYINCVNNRLKKIIITNNYQFSRIPIRIKDKIDTFGFINALIVLFLVSHFSTGQNN